MIIHELQITKGSRQAVPLRPQSVAGVVADRKPGATVTVPGFPGSTHLAFRGIEEEVRLRAENSHLGHTLRPQPRIFVGVASDCPVCPRPVCPQGREIRRNDYCPRFPPRFPPQGREIRRNGYCPRFPLRFVG